MNDAVTVNAIAARMVFIFFIRVSPANLFLFARSQRMPRQAAQLQY
jgi:uncharacterized membrane protein